MAQIIDGKAIAAKIRAEITAEAAKLTEQGVMPGLAVVLGSGLVHGLWTQR